LDEIKSEKKINKQIGKKNKFLGEWTRKLEDV